MASKLTYGTDMLILNDLSNTTNSAIAGLICGSNNTGSTGSNSLISGAGNNTNTGTHCLISGSNNYSNSGNYTAIFGSVNNDNAGDYCLIVGGTAGPGNTDNTGDHCIIAGTGNSFNSGDFCAIFGNGNSTNSGYRCLICGTNNTNNSGSDCSISGDGNKGNFGTHSIIGGKVTAASTKIAISGTSAEADDNLISNTSHGLTLNQPVRFTTLTGGTGLSTATLYYARTILSNTFAVSLTVGGAEVDITVDYSVANFIGNMVNHGNFNVIGGEDNEGTTGSWCNISGDQNYNNSGDNCLIAGDTNHSNTGTHCSISGNGNHTNTGNHCSISGYNNYSNSGSRCLISGYGNHSNSGNHCSFSGYENHTNSGGWCLISGNGNNTNTGDYCLIAGSNNDTNTGDFSVLTGYYALNTRYGARVHAAGRFAAQGDAQHMILVARKSVLHDDAAWTALTLDGGTAGVATTLDIQADSVWNFSVKLVGTTQGCAKSFGFNIQGILENDGGTTSLLQSNVDTQYDTDDTDFDARVTADNTNDALLIEVSDSTSGSDTVRWVAVVDIVKVGFPA